MLYTFKTTYKLKGKDIVFTLKVLGPLGTKQREFPANKTYEIVHLWQSCVSRCYVYLTVSCFHTKLVKHNLVAFLPTSTIILVSKAKKQNTKWLFGEPTPGMSVSE